MARVVNAVPAQAERSGATILAEGIETDQHVAKARAMGATLGQGWLFGRPGPLRATAAPAEPLAFNRVDDVQHRTPFAALRPGVALRTATKGMLLPMSHHLEDQAFGLHDHPVLLAAFEDADHFTPATARRYGALAAHCAFVGALGAGMAARPVAGAPNVRGADLPTGDVLRGEWVVAVVGPHFAGALVAQDLHDTGPDRDRRFRFTITYDRPTVVDVARSLLSRIVPTP